MHRKVDVIQILRTPGRVLKETSGATMLHLGKNITDDTSCDIRLHRARDAAQTVSNMRRQNEKGLVNCHLNFLNETEI